MILRSTSQMAQQYRAVTVSPAAQEATTHFSPTNADNFTRSEKTLGLGKDISTLAGGTVFGVIGTAVGAVAGYGTSWTGFGGAAAGLVIGGLVGGLVCRTLYSGMGDPI